jgi:ribose transport system substrate-binding protein
MSVVAVLASVGLAACGSSNKTSGSPATTQLAAAKSSNDPAFISQARANVAKLYQGDFGSPPASTPAPPKNKTVWVLACSTVAALCAENAKDTTAAMQALGWHTKVLDGKLTPSVYAQIIRQAIAAKVDGLILAAVNCVDVPGPLAQAKAAGIKLAAAGAADCPGHPVFDTGEIFKGGLDYVQMERGPMSTAQADYIVAKTNGNAKIVAGLETDNAIAAPLAEGFEQEIKSCTTCTVYPVTFTVQDLIGNKLKGEFSTALVEHPDTNAVLEPYDASVTLGIGPAVAASGRHPLVMGGEGLPPNLDLIRQNTGQEDAAIAFPVAWAAWGLVDNLVRVFDGQKGVDQGVGLELVDRQHGLPPSGQFINPTNVNWKADYLRNWGR